MRRPALDPFSREVIQSQLVAAAEEMSIALRRTAYSPIIWDELDYACALFTPRGELIAQAQTIPAQLGVMSTAIRSVLERHGSRILPGDLFIHNHPYLGATHTPDLILFEPVHLAGRRIGWSGSVAHHVDVGGRVPGSEAPDSRQIYEEGLLLPPVRLFRGGEPDRDLWELLRANVRDPASMLGDLRAQVAACHLGARRLLEVARETGRARLLAAMEAILDQTERATRAEIGRLPRGVWRAEGWMDNEVDSTLPLRIAATVRVGRARVHVDFRGTDPQHRGSLNNPWASTLSAVYFAVKCFLRPHLAQNEGGYRPVRVSAPVGTLVRPRFPAAVSSRHLTQQRVADVVLRALARAAPERAAAGCSVAFPAFTIDNHRPDSRRRPYFFVEILGGGFGAGPRADGASAVDTHLGNCALLQAEVAESEYPWRIERTALVPDSGGAGRHRGGLGLMREYVLLDDVAWCGHYLEQVGERAASWGMAGGRPGGLARAEIRRAGRWVRLSSKETRFEIRRGERLRYISSGGGGWGPPSRRDRAAVEDDLRNGYVTHARAASVYGRKPDRSIRAIRRGPAAPSDS
jgi:N-methylhydantoinase B